MRRWAAVVVCAVACASSDDDQDSDPTDTDAPDDTDTQTSDTDTPGDTDTTDDTDAPPDELDCTFEKCGGDVVGDWTIDGICFPDLGNPFEQLCKTSTYTFNYDATGTFGIHQDYTFEVSALVTLSATGTFPVECNAGVTSCTDWESAQVGMTCTGDVAVQCDCVLTVGPFPQIDYGQWAYDGDDVVFDGIGTTTPDGGGDDLSTYAYCQDGDSLDLKLKGGLPIQYVLSR